MTRRAFDPDHCTACGDFLPCGESWTVTADEAYDRLHGVDGHTQASTCRDCGHHHTLDGCTGPPTPSDRWAGVSPSACDCDRWHSKHRWHCATNYTAERNSR